MTPAEIALNIELRERDIAEQEARERRAVVNARRTVACLLAVFWIAVGAFVWSVFYG